MSLSRRSMDIFGDFPNGIKFVGIKGWFLVTRTEQTTPTDMGQGTSATGGVKATGLEASDPRILESVIGPDDIHLYKSAGQHGNWLDCIRTRQAKISPVEMGHRACSTCLIHQIAMHAEGRHLHWHPQAERLLKDDAANAQISRTQRAKYAFMAS